MCTFLSHIIETKNYHCMHVSFTFIVTTCKIQNFSIFTFKVKMASQEHPFSVGHYQNMSSQESNVFYGDSPVKKDSEIQLTDQQAHELIRKAELHSPSAQQLVLSSTSDAAGSSVVTSTSAENKPLSKQRSGSQRLSVDLNSSGELSDDSRQLSQSDRQHVCMTCYKAFRNKPQLSQHELVHNNMRKHVCSYCDKSFKQICHLNQHIRVHTGKC